jgi:pimeloyl-ACP methyl ester carboxylesterase
VTVRAPPAALSVSANGLPLHAMQWNAEGPVPVLFLHGWMDNGRGWDWVIEALPDSVRAIALDFRGHGQSGHLAEGAVYHYPDYLMDVECTLDALGLAQVHLVGHSMGGSVACGYACARPDRVRSVTLVENLGTLGGAPDDSIRRLRGFLDQYKKPSRKRTYASVDEAAARVRENNPRLPPECALQLTKHGTRPVEGGVQFTFDPRVRHQMGMGYDEEQLLSILGEIRCPVQVVFGTRSHFTLPRDVWDRRVAKLRACELHPLEGGHHVHMERPRETAALIERLVATAG